MENDVASSYLSGWWFGTFFIFPCIGNNNPRGVRIPPTRVWFYGGISRSKKPGPRSHLKLEFSFEGSSQKIDVASWREQRLLELTI